MAINNARLLGLGVASSIESIHDVRDQFNTPVNNTTIMHSYEGTSRDRYFSHRHRTCSEKKHLCTGAERVVMQISLPQMYRESQCAYPQCVNIEYISTR